MRKKAVAFFACGLVAWGVAGQIASSAGHESAAAHLGLQQRGRPVQLADVDELRDGVGYDVLDQQYQALTRMPRISVSYAINGTVREVWGSTGVYFHRAKALFALDAPAPKVMEAFGPLVLATGTEELRVTRVGERHIITITEADSVPFPSRTIKFKQYIRGLPVLLGWANIGVNEDTGEVTAFVSHFLPDRGLPSKPTITSAQATERLLIAMRADAPNGPPELTLSSAAPALAYAFKKIGDQGANEGDLVWVINVFRRDSRRIDEFDASVSATTGEVLRFESKMIY